MPPKPVLSRGRSKSMEKSVEERPELQEAFRQSRPASRQSLHEQPTSSRGLDPGLFTGDFREQPAYGERSGERGGDADDDDDDDEKDAFGQSTPLGSRTPSIEYHSPSLRFGERAAARDSRLASLGATSYASSSAAAAAGASTATAAGSAAGPSDDTHAGAAARMSSAATDTSAAEAASSSPDSTMIMPQACLFVANLNSTKSDEYLYRSVTAFLSTWGRLFSRIADAKRAMQDATGRLLDDRPIRIEQAKVNRTLFLKFGAQYSHDEILEELEEHGPVEHLSILHDKETGLSKGCGFAKFFSREHAIMAFLYEFRATKIDKERVVDYNSIFIGKINPERVTEDELRRRFARYGEIESLQLWNRFPRGPTSRPAFAFIRYADEKVAEIAIEEENGSSWLDRIIKVQYREVDPRAEIEEEEQEPEIASEEPAVSFSAQPASYSTQMGQPQLWQGTPAVYGSPPGQGWYPSAPSQGPTYYAQQPPPPPLFASPYVLQQMPQQPPQAMWYPQPYSVYSPWTPIVSPQVDAYGRQVLQPVAGTAFPSPVSIAYFSPPSAPQSQPQPARTAAQTPPRSQQPPQQQQRTGGAASESQPPIRGTSSTHPQQSRRTPTPSQASSVLAAAAVAPPQSAAPPPSLMAVPQQRQQPLPFLAPPASFAQQPSPFLPQPAQHPQVNPHVPFVMVPSPYGPAIPAPQFIQQPPPPPPPLPPQQQQPQPQQQFQPPYGWAPAGPPPLGPGMGAGIAPTGYYVQGPQGQGMVFLAAQPQPIGVADIYGGGGGAPVGENVSLLTALREESE
ncbi:hypothetical protein DFJ73DRAFT_896463 [Zopfochytrium polystomum]|nr:hypothetical protein DFJ73DRAFT_896463 [Zopfochytrium polystomum]